MATSWGHPRYKPEWKRPEAPSSAKIKVQESHRLVHYLRSWRVRLILALAVFAFAAQVYEEFVN